MSWTQRTKPTDDNWNGSPSDKLYVYLADESGNIIQDESSNDIIVKFYDGDTRVQRTPPAGGGRTKRTPPI